MSTLPVGNPWTLPLWVHIPEVAVSAGRGNLAPPLPRELHPAYRRLLTVSGKEAGAHGAFVAPHEGHTCPRVPELSGVDVPDLQAFVPGARTQEVAAEGEAAVGDSIGVRPETRNEGLPGSLLNPLRAPEGPAEGTAGVGREQHPFDDGPRHELLRVPFLQDLLPVWCRMILKG